MIPSTGAEKAAARGRGGGRRREGRHPMDAYHLPRLHDRPGPAVGHRLSHAASLLRAMAGPPQLPVPVCHVGIWGVFDVYVCVVSCERLAVDGAPRGTGAHPANQTHYPETNPLHINKYTRARTQTGNASRTTTAGCVIVLTVCLVGFGSVIDPVVNHRWWRIDGRRNESGT